MDDEVWENRKPETFDDYAQYQLLKQILAELKKQTEYLVGIYNNSPAY